MNSLENIFLMRHAQSAGNENLALYKHIPDHAISLAECGFAQARDAGKHFAEFLKQSPKLCKQDSFRLWYSPYLRTKQTRDGLLAGMGENTNIFRDYREHILLKEQSWGLFEGLTDEEIEEKYPEDSRKYNLLKEYSGKFYARLPNGESRYDVCVRVHQFFGTIIRDAERIENPVKNIFVVSHGTTARAFTMMWLHKEVEWIENEPRPENASIRWIGRDENGRFIDKGYIFDGFIDPSD